MDYDSIISLLSDSETSIRGSLANDTFTTAKNSTTVAYGDSGIGSLNASFLKREFGEHSSIAPTPIVPRPRRSSSAPPVRKQMTEVTFKFFSPEQSALPEIVVVPPSTDRKRGRRSNRSPSQIKRYNFGTRRKSSLRTTAAAPPLVTVREKEDSDVEESSKDPFFSARSEVTIQVNSPSKFDNPECSFVLSSGNDSIGTIIFQTGNNNNGGGGAVSKNKPSSLGVKRQSHLLSPREKTICRKSPNVAQKLSANKINAILMSTDFKVLSTSAKPYSAVKEPPPNRKTFTVPPQSNIQPPKVIAKKDLNVKVKPLATTPSPNQRRTVAFVSPFAQKGASTPVVSPSQTVIRGVRMNRRFDLLMKHRYNVAANNK